MLRYTTVLHSTIHTHIHTLIVDFKRGLCMARPAINNDSVAFGDFLYEHQVFFFSRTWRLFVQASGIFYSRSTLKTTRAPGFNHAHHHVVWLYLCTSLCLLFQHSQRDVRNKAETKHCSSLSCFLWYGIPNVLQLCAGRGASFSRCTCFAFSSISD